MFKVLNFTSERLNFIDDQDNFVGFDDTNGCCAHGDWFISEVEQTEVTDDYSKGQQIKEYPDYFFDEAFFKEVSIGEGSMVIFKLKSYRGKPELFLHLFNQHNGYYARGFKSVLGSKVIEGGI